MKPQSLAILFLLFSTYSFSSEEIIQKKYYTINYNEEHEVPNWVSYELDQEMLRNCTKRRNNFRPDPEVSTGTATNDDYKGTGLDRGHLVPAGDMKFSKFAMTETFYFSNMTPQPGKFNRGRWSQLENLIRSWAFLYEKIWIVTGPILREGLPSIGKLNHVSVPDQYFKVILRKDGESFSGIGFIMATDIPFPELDQYATSINEIESLAGFDFFQFIDDLEEEKIESEIELVKWDFAGTFEYLPCQTVDNL
jgi:endonuclease G